MVSLFRLSGKRPSSSPHGSSLQPVPEIVLPDDWNVDDKKRLFLEETNQQGCAICGWSGRPSDLLEFSRSTALIEVEGSRCVGCEILALVLRKCLLEISATKSDIVHVKIGDRDGRFRAYNLKRTLHTVGAIVIHANVHDNALPFQIPSRSLIQYGTLSATSFQWAQKQLSICFETHSSCYDAQETSLPTRLVNVNAEKLSGDVVLVESSSLPHDSRYVALSYCWGGYEPHCRTMRSTLKERKERIPWSILPKTFRDAVTFTRKLGVSYLWVDSICIIQDDLADWTHESGRMFEIYRASYVTLAALWGSDSICGLFSEVNERVLEPDAMIRLGQQGWPVHFELDHEPYYNWSSSSGALFKRAWAYQERLISPRVLLFAKKELAFQCYNNADCECGADRASRKDYDWSSKTEHDTKRFFSETVIRNRNKTQRAGIDNAKSRPSFAVTSFAIEMAWRDHVGTYSGLHLSVEGDRLPAIGAVAKQFQTVRPREQYLAGLWSGSLLRDLLWYAKIGPNVRYNETRRNRSRESEATPSWSWAFHGGEVCYPSWPRRLRSGATIIHATCKYRDRDPFGVLENNTLTLRGLMCECWAEKDRHDSYRLRHRRAGPHFVKSMEIHMDYSDCVPTSWIQRRFYFLDIAIDSGHCYYGLILKREDATNHKYSRIGIAMDSHERTADEYEAYWRDLQMYGTTTTCTII